MRIDRLAMQEVAAAGRPATLRFFRWAQPSASYGRLQKLDDIRPLIPHGWPVVQRPTGGGVVLHRNDLCMSLCWPDGQPPLPAGPSAQYEWIHRTIRDALASLILLEWSSAHEAQDDFETRECFSNPVQHDLVFSGQKIVGGALARRRGVTLYQGSIQSPGLDAAEAALSKAFERSFAGAHV